EQRPFSVVDVDELSDPARRGRQEGDSVIDALVDNVRRVVDSRRDDCEATRMLQVLPRLELVEFTKELKVTNCLLHARVDQRTDVGGRIGGFSPEERDGHSAQEVRAQTIQGRHECRDTLSVLEATEEDEF